MNKSKNTKNKILLSTLLTISVISISVGLVFVDWKKDEIQNTNENAISFENEKVLDRPLVKKLGWDKKEKIYLSDWEAIPNVTIIGYGDTWENSPFHNNDGYNKNKLKYIEIPDRVTEIGAYAFGGIGEDGYGGPTQALEQIVFSKNSQLTKIGSRAFQHANLKSLWLPTSVSYIHEDAFISTINLKGEKISLPFYLSQCNTDKQYGFTNGTWKNIKWRDEVFSGTTLTDTIVLASGWNLAESIKLQDWKDKAPNVTKIDKKVFQNNTLKRIEIPNTIEVIEPYGLSANNLATIIFEENSSLHTIWEYAFADTDITEFIVSDNVTTIGDNAFANTSLLRGDKVSIQSRWIKGSLDPLYGFNELQWTTINWRWEPFTGSVLTITDAINLGWDKKTKIYLGDWLSYAKNVTEIGDDVFKNYLKLETIQLPETIRKIGNSSFMGAKQLKKVEFVENKTNLKEIGNDAFNGTGLEEIYLGNQVTTIGENAFANTTSLIKATFSYKVTHNSLTALYGFSQKVWEGAIILDLPKTGMIDKIIARELLKKDDNIISWYSIQDYNGIDVEAFANTNITKIDIQANAGEFILENDVFKNTTQLKEIKLDKSHEVFINVNKYGLTTQQIENITYYGDVIPPEPDKILNISAKKVSQEVIDAAYDILQKGQLENFTPEEIDALSTIFTNIKGNEDNFKVKLYLDEGVKNVTLKANEGYIFAGDKGTIDSIVDPTIIPTPNPGGRSNTGLIVGTSLGGVGLIVMIGVVIYLVKKLSQKSDLDDGENNGDYVDVIEQYNYEENDEFY